MCILLVYVYMYVYVHVYMYMYVYLWMYALVLNPVRYLMSVQLSLPSYTNTAIQKIQLSLPSYTNTTIKSQVSVLCVLSVGFIEFDCVAGVIYSDMMRREAEIRSPSDT